MPSMGTNCNGAYVGDHPTKPGVRGGTTRKRKQSKAAKQARKRNRK